MISALVFSNNETITASLGEVFLREGYQYAAATLDVAGLGLLRELDPQHGLVTVVLSPNPEPALALLAELRHRTSGRILVVGPAVDPKLILRANREGADQYLDEADAACELECVLFRLRAQGLHRSEPARLICLLGASGGSGSSTLAVNLATLLAREHQSCMLFDLKPGAGDLAALLDLKPTHTLADLSQHAPHIDRVLFERSLSRHESGVHVLAPPPLISGDTSRIIAQAFGQALTLARSLFPYVLADLEDCVHEEQAGALAQADVILLVLRLDFTSLRNARAIQDRLDQLGVPRERIRLVANRYGQPKEMPYAKAEDALGLKIFHYVPDDPRTINWCNNNGIPAVLSSPRAGVSKSLARLAHSINGRHHSP